MNVVAIIHCDVCGKPTPAKRATRKYCGPQCTEDARHIRDGRSYADMIKERAEKPCKTCGKIFKPKRYTKVFCSEKCQPYYLSAFANTKTSSRTRHCVICDTQFKVDGYNKCCSDPCRRKLAKLRAAHKRTLKIVACKRCGHLFHKVAGQRICKPCAVEFAPLLRYQIELKRGNAAIPPSTPRRCCVCGANVPPGSKTCAGACRKLYNSARQSEWASRKHFQEKQAANFFQLFGAIQSINKTYEQNTN